MTRFVLSLLMAFCVVQNSAAQQLYKVTGVVYDTFLNAPLYLSSVMLVRSADSVLETYARANDNGIFELSTKKSGKYILRIVRPGYADYSDFLNLTDALTNIDTVAMLSNEHLLKEFVFTQQVAAIKIKGDTTEYMADSFLNKEGASVEELLKKLPGIQVDKNGKITAHGTTVEKVLVDGEEFFSDDPKVVTQGLQAAVVSKVQVYDKKSDQAEFTGIDDGEKTRTINLQLKENKKKGYFGKLDAGGGTDGYYQQQGMINGFKGKRQLAAFGIISNTDKVGLGWDEGNKYGGSAGITEIGDDGSWNMIGTSFDEFSGWSGRYEGDGLPRVWTGGGHYANKWNEDKLHASASYRYALQQVDIGGNNSRILALAGDTSRVNTENKKQFNSGERHSLKGLLEWSIDTLTSLKMAVNGGVKKNYSSSEYRTETYNLAKDAAGAKTLNDRDISAFGDEQTMNIDLLLRRKFAKRGRTLSLDLKENYKNTNGGGMLYAVTTSTDSAVVDVTDQKKVNNSNSLSLYGKVVYTEPLSKVAFLETNYSMTVNNSSALNSSLDRDPSGGDYTVLRDSFSSDYRYNILINRGGLGMKFVYKMMNFSFGGDVSNSSFLQTDLLNGDTSVRYNFINLFPKANFTYKIARQTSLRASYNGRTKQPTIQQIQPLNQNTDPLNIVTGNPNLKQEFMNSFSLNFNNYKTLKDRYLYVGGSFNTVADAISTSQTTDGAVYKTQYINVDGNYDANWYSGYNFKLKKPEINIGFSFDGSTGRVNNLVNNQKNVSINNRYTFGPNVSYRKENKFDFSWTPNVTYNYNTSTVNSLPLNYWMLENELNGEVELPKNIEVGSSATMMIRQKTAVFTDNNSIVKWNAFVSKKFLKKKELIVKLQVFDILNQNLGFTRSAQGNMVTQNSYLTIRRYGMLSVAWNFTHTPGVTAMDEDED